jgi:hypothetical protein
MSAIEVAILYARRKRFRVPLLMRYPLLAQSETKISGPCLLGVTLRESHAQLSYASQTRKLSSPVPS